MTHEWLKLDDLTPEEWKLWEQMNQRGNELTKDMVAAMAAVDRLPEWMQAGAVNMLCDKLAECRALACSWANDHGEP